MKGLYIVLSGSKKTIEENEEKIRGYLNTFKRKIGLNEVRCATIQREISIDNEHNTMTRFRLDELPEKFQYYLKHYKAVILKYRPYGKTGYVYAREPIKLYKKKS